MLQQHRICLLILLFISGLAKAQQQNAKPAFYAANHPQIHYTGRIDFSNPLLPRYWQPGVYVSAKFEGSFCNVIVQDEMLWGKNHNYLEIAVDDTLLYRIATKGKRDTIRVVKDLRNTAHTIVITKNTEANIGYLQFAGLQCKSLLPLPPAPQRRMEFYGNSITCGTGADQSAIACGAGVWQDQHNAYLAYGPLTARALGAQWMLSSVSGIGLVHSCCNMDVVMPMVYDHVNMRDANDSLRWDFKRYPADVVSVCLGQNDGIQDSSLFCQAYVGFVHQLRGQYPKAQIICLTSPMADSTLAAAQKKYLAAITAQLVSEGDNKVSHYFFTKRYHHGCDSHPDLAEHEQIAAELTAYVKTLLQW